MTWGITPQGFNSKPSSQIESEIDAGLQGILGESAGTEPDGTIPLRSMAGQMKAFLTDGFSSMWDLAEGVSAGFDPNNATDERLDAVCSITGTERDGAESSTVTATCTGDPGTVLLVSRVATVDVTGDRFVSTVQATIAVPTLAWHATTAYVVGNRITSNNRMYQCIVSGTTDVTAPSTTDEDITDGSVHWLYLGDGTGSVDVVFASETAGPIGASVNTLRNIATPVNGWRGINNLLDAAVGANRETDPALRVRRDAETASAGLTTANAIRAHLVKINEGSSDPAHLPPTSVHVFQNNTDLVDANGLPPHSVEALVLGAPDQDVANAIFACVAAGINIVGTSSATVIDSEGNPQTIHFTRPTAVPVYIRADVSYDPTAFPTDLSAGADLIKDALVLYGQSVPVGRSVRSSALEAQVFDGPTAVGASPVPGILDVTALYIGTAPAPTSPATVPIAARQLATFSAAHITVNLSSGTP